MALAVLAIISRFFNVVVSFGGAGGFIFLVEDAKNRGHSAASATAGSLMIITTDFISITIISIIGLVYLFTKNNLQTYEVAAAVILIALTVFLSSMMMLTFRWPKHLKSILLSFRNTANLVLKKFGRSFTITEQWVDEHWQEFVNAAAASRKYQN